MNKDACVCVWKGRKREVHDVFLENTAIITDETGINYKGERPEWGGAGGESVT